MLLAIKGTGTWVSLVPDSNGPGAAKANGMWTFLDDVERLEVPGDLATAIGKHAENWEGWSRSVKRAWLEKIKWAKTAPTRAKRIAACADAVAKNLKDGGLR